MTTGDFAQRLFREAPVPVLAVPEQMGAAPPSLSRILFIFEEFEAALRGSRQVIEMAQFCEAPVSLLHTRLHRPVMAGLLPAWLGGGLASPGERHDSEPSQDEALLSLFHRREVPVEFVQGSGAPFDAVSAVLAGHPCDLIMVAGNLDSRDKSPALASRILEELALPICLIHGSPQTFPATGSPSPFQVRF